MELLVSALYLWRLQPYLLVVRFEQHDTNTGKAMTKVCLICNSEDATVLDVCHSCYTEMRIESDSAGQNFREYWVQDCTTQHNTTQGKTMDNIRIAEAIKKAVHSIDRGTDFSLIRDYELKIAVELIDAAIEIGLISKDDFEAEREDLIDRI